MTNANDNATRAEQDQRAASTSAMRADDPPPTLLEPGEDHQNATGWPVIVTQLDAHEPYSLTVDGDVLPVSVVPLLDEDGRLPTTMAMVRHRLLVLLATLDGNREPTNAHTDQVTHVFLRPVSATAEGLVAMVSAVNTKRGVHIARDGRDPQPLDEPAPRQR